MGFTVYTASSNLRTHSNLMSCFLELCTLYIPYACAFELCLGQMVHSISKQYKKHHMQYTVASCYIVSHSNNHINLAQTKLG